MTTLTKIIAPICGLFLLAMAGTASSSGDNRFACHVLTESKIPTISFIQTDTLANAIKVALRNPARLPDGNRSPVTEVVECIDGITKNKFRDATIQNYLVTMPL